MTYVGNPGEEISSGQPKAYLDYIDDSYGAAFRSGTNEAAETFYLLFQQFSALGNETSTELFLSRFLPMLPRSARRKILNDVMESPQSTRRDA